MGFPPLLEVLTHEILDCLRGVAQPIRLASSEIAAADGNFSIEIEGEEVVIPESAIASIAYEIEDGRAEIEFQMTWDVESAVDDDDDADEGDDAENKESETEGEAKSEAADETEAAA